MNLDDEAIDSAAVRAFTEEFGDRAASLPPVAIVIAAFNEEGAIGPVVEDLPATENSGQTVDRPDLRSCAGR